MIFTVRKLIHQINIISGLFKSVSLVILGLGSFQAFGASVDLTATFKPDPLKPFDNKFKNTTLATGYCASFPASCVGFSSSLFAGRTNAAPISANNPEPREGAMLKVPRSFKEVTVKSLTGEERIVQVRVVGFGARYNVTPAIAHAAVWGSSWVNAPANCSSSGVGSGNGNVYTFFWLFNNNNACIKTARSALSSFYYDSFSFAYELNTPDPLQMSAGQYSGSVTYSLGPYGDFDFGDVFIPQDQELKLNFTLSVEHIFNVVFPVGADRLTLVPDGGWQQWLQHGRRPVKLFANQSFQIWSSGAFKMNLQCQYLVGEQCGIQNGDGDLVPVETRVTLPPGIAALSGMSVNRHLLSNSSPSIFHPSQYVDNGRATLHFEVGRDSVAQMTNHAGTRYEGNVTIVWDSEL